MGEVEEEPDGLPASKCLSALNNEVSGLYFTEGLGFTPHPFVSQRQAIRADKAEPLLINILRRSCLKWGGSQTAPLGLDEYTIENNDCHRFGGNHGPFSFMEKGG